MTITKQEIQPAEDRSYALIQETDLGGRIITWFDSKEEADAFVDRTTCPAQAQAYGDAELDRCTLDVGHPGTLHIGERYHWSRR